MIAQDISHHRLVAQKLYKTLPSSPQAVVAHLGAIQSQNYAMAKWAIGSRCDASEKVIEQAINSAQIIRTHILRPTWHFVAAEDIYWMLDMSGPQVKRIVTAYAKKYGFDAKQLDQMNTSIEKILSGNNHLTRDELMQELDLKKAYGEGSFGGLIMMYAELDGLICNGIMKDKQNTYALLAERVAKPNSTLSKEEALAKLGKRYFESHGPATLLDFCWWSGFSPTICKPAISSIDSELNSVEMDNQQYWFGTHVTDAVACHDSVYFLPAFDELLIAYKTRETSILREYQSAVITRNGIFKPIIVENGQVIGIWKKTTKTACVKIETQFFHDLSKDKKTVLFEHIGLFNNYLGNKVSIE